MVQDKFSSLWAVRDHVDQIFTEAGWLRIQAIQAQSTEKQKETADTRYKEAWKAANEAWDGQKSLSYGLEVKTAACGKKGGPWTIPPAKCDLKPQDPVMKA